MQIETKTRQVCSCCSRSNYVAFELEGGDATVRVGTEPALENRSCSIVDTRVNVRIDGKHVVEVIDLER